MAFCKSSRPTISTTKAWRVRGCRTRWSPPARPPVRKPPKAEWCRSRSGQPRSGPAPSQTFGSEPRCGADHDDRRRRRRTAPAGTPVPGRQRQQSQEARRSRSADRPTRTAPQSASMCRSAIPTGQQKTGDSCDDGRPAKSGNSAEDGAFGILHRMCLFHVDSLYRYRKAGTILLDLLLDLVRTEDEPCGSRAGHFGARGRTNNAAFFACFYAAKN